MIRCKIILFLSCLSCFGQPIWNDVVGLSGMTSNPFTNAPPESECAEWFVATNFNQFLDIDASVVCQYIPTNTPVELCGVDAHFYSYSGGRTAYFEVRDAPNGGGNSLGVTYTNVLDGPGQGYRASFDFVTNITPSGPFYVYARTDFGSAVFIQFSDNSPGQEVVTGATRLTNYSLSIILKTK